MTDQTTLREPDGPGDQAGIAELLWGLRERARRGPKPALSIDQIAQSAIDIADAEGLGAVSMQRVAAGLGVTKMAMYRYVAGKAELFAVMIEAAVGQPPDLTRVPGSWRPRLEIWARHMWATWDQHPWLPGATVGDRVMGPTETGWTESAVSALADTGLDGAEQMDAVSTLSGHIRNTRSANAAGTQPWTTQNQLALLHAHPDRYPALTAAVASAAGPSARERSRQFGLARILDGLEILIAERSAAG